MNRPMQSPFGVLIGAEVQRRDFSVTNEGKKGLFGVIHKPRGQLMGEGISQMTNSLHSKPYLVKVTLGRKKF